jgi:hypothetical protein
VATWVDSIFNSWHLLGEPFVGARQQPTVSQAGSVLWPLRLSSPRVIRWRS